MKNIEVNDYILVKGSYGNKVLEKVIKIENETGYYTKEDIIDVYKNVDKDKLLWLIDILNVLDDMNIYLPDIAEEDNLDLDYKDISNGVKLLKYLVKSNLT